MERRLSAIFSADVKGYSRLMGEDEVATIQTLTAYRELITNLIQRHRGRVVDSPGDNLLAEFGSVVAAVECAAEIQKELKARNEELPLHRKMEFRIGINLGDVVVEGERIYGEGVNIAARLEGLAEGGGICISRPVFDQVKNKLDLGFEFIGAQEVKNIAEPVRAYRVLMEPEAAGPSPAAKPLEHKPPVLAEVASEERMAFPLPEAPSIAVLPFENLSGDPEQGYLTDSITENVISVLSRASNLFVISRNSTFTYRGKPVKVRRVAEELGVHYVLEGSVQIIRDWVRITVLLTDALTGHQMLAKRYDRNVDEILSLQDEITKKVLTTLEVKLTEGGKVRLWRGQTKDPEAYWYHQRGLQYLRRHREADEAKAVKHFERAVSLDPDFADAWVELGNAHLRARHRSAKEHARAIERAVELARKALAIDDSNPDAYALLGRVHAAKKDYEKAIAFGKKAVALNPNRSSDIARLAETMTNAGRPEEALELIKKAMRLNPFYPHWFLLPLGNAYRLMGKFDEAIAAFELLRERNPESSSSHIALAYTHAQAGRKEKARAAAANVLKRRPGFSVNRYAKGLPYRDPAEVQRIADALLEAGLPE